MNPVFGWWLNQIAVVTQAKRRRTVTYVPIIDRDLCQDAVGD
jgi:hypothetical protein